MKPKNVDQYSQRSKMLTIADEQNICSLRLGEFYYMSGDGKKKLVGVNNANEYEMWQTPSNAEDGRRASKVLKKYNGDAVKAMAYLLFAERL